MCSFIAYIDRFYKFSKDGNVFNNDTQTISPEKGVQGTSVILNLRDQSQQSVFQLSCNISVHKSDGTDNVIDYVLVTKASQIQHNWPY